MLNVGDSFSVDVDIQGCMACELEEDTSNEWFKAIDADSALKIEEENEQIGVETIQENLPPVIIQKEIAPFIAVAGSETFWIEIPQFLDPEDDELDWTITD